MPSWIRPWHMVWFVGIVLIVTGLLVILRLPVVSRRHEKKSFVLTTSLAFNQLGRD